MEPGQPNPERRPLTHALFMESATVEIMNAYIQYVCYYYTVPYTRPPFVPKDKTMLAKWKKEGFGEKDKDYIWAFITNGSITAPAPSWF